MSSDKETRRAASRSGRETPVTQTGIEANEAIIRNGDGVPHRQPKEPISIAQASSSSTTNARTERSEVKRKEYTRQTVDTGSKASSDQTGADIRRRPSRTELPERSRRPVRQDPGIDSEAVPAPEPIRRAQKTVTRPKTPVEVALPVLDASEVEGKTRAEILGSWKRKNGEVPVKTSLLLRDMLYLLQGIDGKHVRFARKTQAEKNREANPYLVEIEFTRKGEMTQTDKDLKKGRARGDLLLGGGIENDDITGVDFVDTAGRRQEVSGSLQSTIVVLAELGMLYRRVYNYVRVTQASAGVSLGSGGMTEQSLCFVLQRELSEYHELLTGLENQMKREASDLPLPIAESDETCRVVKLDFPVENSGMTFQRLSLWTEDFTLKMRMMSTLVDEASSAKGGALISAIHGHTLHGDPSVREFANHVLEEVSKPFFNSLQSWIFSGQLHDPFNEFFIQLNGDLNKRSLARHSPHGDYGFGGGDSEFVADDPHMIWEKRYIFVKDMLPSFINEEFGRKIFITGKSINFIRFSCHDSEWTSIQAQFAQDDAALTHGDISHLERTIDAAYSSASKRLLDIFFDRFKLLEHLDAMRQYVLLCAGDFADILLEGLGPRLDRDASKLLRHHLASDIETAIQGSNARHEPEDVLRRLDAQIMPFGSGAIGWDCFSLQYKVEAPINAVLDDIAIDDYNKIFMYLWKVRRVAASQTKRWLRNTFEPRRFRDLEGHQRAWHRCHILQAQMIHFVAELQAFCQLEAIELAWQDMVEFERSREGDLDALIAAHRTYLANIKAKALLLNPRDASDDSLHLIVDKLLQQIMTFGRQMDALHNLSVGERTRLTQKAEVERGVLPASVLTDNGEKSAGQLRDLEKQIKDQAQSFKLRMTDLIGGLESHSNYEVKFLAVRLSFNEVYVVKRSKSTRSNTKRT